MKQIFYLIFIFSFIEVNAQTDKNYILRTNFGYSFSHKDMLDAGAANFGWYYYGVKNNDLNFTISGGRKLKSNFYYGLGLFYNTFSQETNPDDDIPKLVAIKTNRTQ